MTVDALDRLRKARHSWRMRQPANVERPKRLIVEKAKWLHDRSSPVVLMIDDLTNAWHGTRAAGGDWGGAHDADDGALAFLESRLLRRYPEARVTFFAVAGPISAYTRHQPFSYAAPLDANESSRAFFTRLCEDPRFELAYHGLNHGTAADCTESFLQEWRGFASAAEALEQTRRGLEIFRNATGRIPTGGKYGGWDYNELADDVVAECGFLWWCRDWMPRDVTGTIPDAYYEPQPFGAGAVIALPSTVHGHWWDRRQVELLLERRQIIAIEEHIAPVRPDGLVQTPNIVDDIEHLVELYAYLRSKSVWHATCSEIAAYVIARDSSTVHDVTLDGFSLRYDGRLERPSLTLRIDCSAVCTPDARRITVQTPDGAVLARDAYEFDDRGYRHQVTVPVMTGRYEVRPAAT